jgi:hypothetical protein
MLPWQAFLLLVMVSALVVVTQEMVAATIEDEIVLFEGECQTVDHDDNPDDVNGVFALKCSDTDTIINISSNQEALYLDLMLTEEVAPVIVCVNKQREITKNERRTCNIKHPSLEETENET